MEAILGGWSSHVTSEWKPFQVDGQAMLPVNGGHSRWHSHVTSVLLTDTME